MIDSFRSQHGTLVFADDSRIRIQPETFAVIRSLAAKPLVQPDLELLESDSSIRCIQLVYELATEMQYDDEADGSGSLQRRLLEAVLLHRFLHELPENALDTNGRRGRVVAVLGAMIQERLTFVLLNTDPDQFEDLLSIRTFWGIDRATWERALMGSASAAKAILELSNIPNIRIYPATILEDVVWGIDLFLEFPDGSGACVSVKTLVGERTNFWTRSPPPQAFRQEQDDWKRVERGADHFNQRTSRRWGPVLIYVGKDNGKSLVLKRFLYTPQWVQALHTQILGRIDTSMV